MSESMSIAQIERQNAGQQAVVRTVMNLQRAGYQNASAEGVEQLTKQFKPLQDMRALLEVYNNGIDAITGDADATDQERIAAYGELRNFIMPQYEQLAEQLAAEMTQRRQQLHNDVFGAPEHSSPSASPADKNTAALSYRDAVYRLQDATPEELDKAAAIAEATGDRALMRAVGVVADMRGDSEHVQRFLAHAGAKATERYEARNALPKGSTVDSLIAGFEPPRVHRGALAPSPIAMDIKRSREAQQAAGEAAMFRS